MRARDDMEKHFSGAIAFAFLAGKNQSKKCQFMQV